ncbi:MAG: hypothetical protein ACRCX8_04635 [Sarcina sp.]
MKLEKPFKIKKGNEEIEIKELKIDPENFTASVVIRSEKEFLMSGGIFPSGAMEDSRAFLLCAASKMLGYRTEDLEDNLSGVDFIKLTNVMKGLFGGTALESLIQNLLGKQQ